MNEYHSPLPVVCGVMRGLFFLCMNACMNVCIALYYVCRSACMYVGESCSDWNGSLIETFISSRKYKCLNLFEPGLVSRYI